MPPKGKATTKGKATPKENETPKEKPKQQEPLIPTPWRQMRFLPKGSYERTVIRDNRLRVEVKFEMIDSKKKAIKSTIFRTNNPARTFAEKIQGIPDNYPFINLIRFEKDSEALAAAASQSSWVSATPAGNNDVNTETSTPNDNIDNVITAMGRNCSLTDAAAAVGPDPLVGVTSTGGRICNKCESLGPNAFANLRPLRTLPDEVQDQHNDSPPSEATTESRLTIAKNKEHFANWYAGVQESTDLPRALKDAYGALEALPTEPKEDEPEIVPPAGYWLCPGNFAFECPKRWHPKSEPRCKYHYDIWRQLNYLLTKFSFQHRHNRASLQKLTMKLRWKVCALAGLYEVGASKKVRKLLPYRVNNGPVCNMCERRVDALVNWRRQSCKACSNGIALNAVPALGVDALRKAVRVTQGPETLVFLCARKSGKDDVLKADTFANLEESIRQSETNPGPYGETNRPGYPTPLQIVGKFTSAASARAPLYMMSRPTAKQARDILPLALLADSIIYNYNPGDTVVVAMSQPTNFCVGHQDLEQIVSALFQRGIPKASLFFYYHTVAITMGVAYKYERVIAAIELKRAILNYLPRYGMRPALSAILYAADKGVFERVNAPRKGRNNVCVDNNLTSSQMCLERERERFCSTTRCSARPCGVTIGNQFAVRCAKCPKWFHGVCAGITLEAATLFESRSLVWICRSCNIEMMLEADDLEGATELALQHRDNAVYPAIVAKGETIGAWTLLAEYLLQFAGQGQTLDVHALIACGMAGNVKAFANHPTLLTMTPLELQEMLLCFRDNPERSSAVVGYLSRLCGDDDDEPAFAGFASCTTVDVDMGKDDGPMQVRHGSDASSPPITRRRGNCLRVVGDDDNDDGVRSHAATGRSARGDVNSDSGSDSDATTLLVFDGGSPRQSPHVLPPACPTRPESVPAEPTSDTAAEHRSLIWKGSGASGNSGRSPSSSFKRVMPKVFPASPIPESRIKRRRLGMTRGKI